MARALNREAEERRRISLADYAALGATLVAFSTLALQGYTLHLQDVREQLREKQAHDAQLAADVRKPLTDISGLLGAYIVERELVQEQLGNLASHPNLSRDQARNDLRRLHNDLAGLTTWQQSQGVLLPSAKMDHALSAFLAQESAYLGSLEQLLVLSPGADPFGKNEITTTDNEYKSDLESCSVFREMVRAYLHQADGNPSQ